MSNENKKSELIEKWNYYKDIPARYNGDNDKFRDLLKDAYKLVDTSDLDKWIEDYDFSREGDESYHKIMGKKFKGFSEYNKDYEEYPTSPFEEYDYGLSAMEKMAQQVLGRCYIELNRLVHGQEEDWENMIKNSSVNWVSRIVRKRVCRTYWRKKKPFTTIITRSISKWNYCSAIRITKRIIKLMKKRRLALV